MDPLFPPHGTLDFSVIDNNILVIEGCGPWHKEVLTKLSSEQINLIKSLYGNACGVWVIILGEPLYTQEASDLLSNIVKQDKERGRKSSAIILKNSSSPDIGEQHISQIYQKASEKFKFFDDKDEALGWLKEKVSACHL
jgi:hypothetical protein